MIVVAKAELHTPPAYVRAPRPLHFPVEAVMPETKRHLELRTVLFALLKTFAAEHSIGSEQFVYWLATEPARCIAPDAFVRLGTPDTSFDSWKTWERGAPQLAVEIVSASDAPEKEWNEKLSKYHELGVQELVRFDPIAPEGSRLRVWDSVDGDLVERSIVDDQTPCKTLGLFWVIAPAESYSVALRVAHDLEGRDLIPTPDEARRTAEAQAKAEAERAKVEAERARAEAERARAEAERARAEAERRFAAERRVAELEAELARRATGGGS